MMATFRAGTAATIPGREPSASARRPLSSAHAAQPARERRPGGLTARVPAEAVPEITCVIPVWDTYAAMLDDAVSSVRVQELPVTVVVVDNASAEPVRLPDGAEVVRLDERVSLGAARNHGLARVASPYVVFLDADDTLLEGSLGALLAALEREPGAPAAIGEIVDATTNAPHGTHRSLARRLARRPGLLAAAHCIWSLLSLQGCALLRTEAVRGAGGYGDANSGEDWTLGASLAWRGRVVFVDAPCLLYRRSTGSPHAGALPVRLQRANARRVRERVRADRAAPAAVKRSLPVLAAAQWAALYGLRPAVKLTRALRDPRRDVPRDELYVSS
jgi:Glycosyl transferase family 2